MSEFEYIDLAAEDAEETEKRGPNLTQYSGLEQVIPHPSAE